MLLELTAADAEQLAAGYAAGRYDRDEFNRRLGGLRRRRLGKHFEWTFDEQTEAFSSRRKQESIRAEERLDGIYVIRTSLQEEQLGDAETVRAYKSLARVERALRSLLAPLLFLDEDRQEGKTGPVGPAVRSERGKRKDRTRETLEGNLPLQSFPDLLAHLTTFSALELRLEAAPEHRVSKLSALTPLQERAFELLGSKPHPAPPPEPIAAEPAEPSH